MVDRSAGPVTLGPLGIVCSFSGCRYIPRGRHMVFGVLAPLVHDRDECRKDLELLPGEM
jgi:hypothetical protein